MRPRAFPSIPVVTGTSKDVMVDPLGGPNRDPYLTWQVNVKDTSGNVVASTQAVAGVGFGGCCSCHLKLAQSYGYTNPTPADSFKVMGMLHGQNSSGIDLSYIDTDGDGVPGPIRCSYCHLDPAMGESVAPGLPAGYKILPGANFSSANVKTSLYTFSDVLHRFHAQDSVVLSSYDPNIAKDCYACHPGNGVNCYRDTHTTKTMNGNAIWCTDCHGDLNQMDRLGRPDEPVEYLRRFPRARPATGTTAKAPRTARPTSSARSSAAGPRWVSVHRATANRTGSIPRRCRPTTRRT